ncbi:DUF805 domain-containing protein [Mucilaginibacter sp. SMC90]|uniref:DUF805 domain-containing protein n=1 Tax=Mucilaginibacter sp. SMC90 TaxID=2929803 RepID=UPI001FB4951C|nr:DUF805 domain-containing protein [Mucilaginibacter sp. SMC90]UOE48395.1 DUF805 domain-containing protein [Mucilaginibacter sp. SMC90]
MFRNLFSFEGRIRRTEYGISFIIYVICYVVVLGIMKSGTGIAGAGVLGMVPLLWFLWSQGAKRCHDLGKSGWFQIIPFYVFVLLFAEGQAGENQYGDNPKGVNAPFDSADYQSPFPSPQNQSTEGFSETKE